MVVLFSVVSVWDFVYLFVCQHDSWTVRNFIMKFSGYYPVVARVDKFENGNIAVRGRVVMFRYLVVT